MISRNESLGFLYVIIFIQFVAIVLLLGGLTNEYLNNAFMQTWVSQNFPLLGLLLNGAADSLLVGVAAGGTILLIRRRLGQAKAESVSARPSRSTPARLPSTPTRETLLPMPDPLPDKPEDVMGELEKQEV